MRVDLAIVGGGPAGLAAGVSAAAYGVNAVVVDEAPLPGGRLRGQLHEHPGLDGCTVWWRGEIEAERLLDQARTAGVPILSSTVGWGLFPGWKIPLYGPGPEEGLEAEAVILATGAVQRSLAMPGWTLPGVLAVGAVQTMINQYRIRPGRRALVVGIDVLSLTVARQLVLAGVEVVGAVLPPPGPLSGARAQPAAVLKELLRLTPLAPNLGLRAAGRFLRGSRGGQLAAKAYPRDGLRVWGVPIMARRSALAIQGTSAVESVIIADLAADGRVEPGTERTEAVDVVCLSGGLSPLNELALQAGCATVYIEELGGHIPLHGPDLSTTVPGLFVAGNITGVEGAPIAMAQGHLAGLAAAIALGRVPARARDEMVQEARARLDAARTNAPIQFHQGVTTARSRLAALWEGRQSG